MIFHKSKSALLDEPCEHFFFVTYVLFIMGLPAAVFLLAGQAVAMNLLAAHPLHTVRHRKLGQHRWVR